MNEEALQDAYQLFAEGGYAGTLEDFTSLISTNPEALNDSFALFAEAGYNGSVEDFSLLMGVKKKDESEIVTVSESASGSLVSPDSQPPSPEEDPGILSNISQQAGDVAEQAAGVGAKIAENVPLIGLPVKAAKFFANLFGDVDVSKAWKTGTAQEDTLDEAFNLMFSDQEKLSDQELENYIAAVTQMDALGPSENMLAFQETYEKEGADTFAFLKGLYENPEVAGELLISSTSAMINPYSGGGAIVGGGTGAAAGSVIPVLGTAAGGISGAVGGGSAVLETGLSYTEFLREELEKKNLPFTKEGIRELYEDEEAADRIYWNAIKRGGIIGLVDFFSTAVGGGAGRKIMKAGKPSIGRSLKAGGTVTGVDVAGGMGGEAAARAATGQEMDAAEIGLEGVPELFGLGGSSLRAFTKIPSYKLGKNKGKKQTVSRETIEEFIRQSTPEEIAAMDYEIKNDPQLVAFIEEKRKEALLLADLDKASKGISLSPDDRQRLMELQKEIGELKDNPTEFARRRKDELEQEADTLIDSYLSGEKIYVSAEEAKKSLAAKGIKKPTEKQILDEQEVLIKEKQKGAPGSPEITTVEEDIEVDERIKKPVLGEEVLVEEETRRGLTYKKYATTTEKDGVKITTYTFNRSDKDPSQRNTTTVKPETAFGTELEIDPEHSSSQLIFEDDMKVVGVENILENPNPRADQGQFQADVVVDIEGDKQTLKGIRLRKKNIKSKVGLKEENKLKKDADKIKITVEETSEGQPGSVSEMAEGVPGELQQPTRKGKPPTQKTTVQPTEEIEVDAEFSGSPQVRVEERTSLAALNTLIREESKAVTSVKDYKKVQREIGKKLKSLVGRGTLTSNQSGAIYNRIGVTNLGNSKAVDNLIKYVDNIYRKANVADQIKVVDKERKKALKNIKRGKLGTMNEDLSIALNTVFNINPSLVPEKKLSDYESLVKEFSVRKKILKLSDLGSTIKKANEIINSMESIAEFEFDDSGALQVPKSKGISKAEINKEAKSIVQDKISVEKIKEIENEGDRELAKRIRKLTTSDIKDLTKEKDEDLFNVGLLETLKAVRANIKEGVVPTAAAQSLLIMLEGKRAAGYLKGPISRTSNTKIFRGLRNFASYAKTRLLTSPSGKNVLLDRLRSQPTFYVDDLFGNFNNDAIYRSVYLPLAEGYSRVNTEVSEVSNDVMAAEKKLGGRGRSNNDVVRSKYKIRYYQLARENESNMVDGKSSKNSPPAIELAKETIKAIKKGKVLNERDGVVLQELIDKYGDKKSEDIFNSLSPREKEALKIYDEINGRLANKVKYISTARGNRVDLINNYSHRVVIGPAEKIKLETLKKSQGFARPSTKAGTIEARLAGPRAISFDPSESALRGTQATVLDYEMTEPIKQVRKTLSLLGEIFEDGTKTEQQVVDALESSVDEILRVTYLNSIGLGSTLGDVMGILKQRAYQAALASVPRAGAEVASNMAFISANPKLATIAFTKYPTLGMSHQLGSDILKRLNSTETSKLYDPKHASSKYGDGREFATVPTSKKQMESSIMNAINYISLPGKKLVQGFDKIAEKLMSAPDTILSRPLWFAKFAEVFAEQTGKKLSVQDFKNIADGKSEYLSEQFDEARKESRIAADRTVIRIATSTNPFNTISKNLPRPGESMKNIYRAMNAYMARFSLFEFATARSAVGALLRRGDMTKLQAAGTLAAVTARMAMYVVLYRVFSRFFDEDLMKLVDEDFGAPESDEEDLAALAGRQVAGAVTTLLTRGSLGNIPSLPIGLGVEYINKNYLESLRNYEEYDPFETSLIFSPIALDDLSSGKKSFNDILASDIAPIAFGPAGPAFRTGVRGGQLYFTRAKSKKSQEKDWEELINRILLLEVPGHLGLIPFYKDIRRIMNKRRFEKED